LNINSKETDKINSKELLEILKPLKNKVESVKLKPINLKSISLNLSQKSQKPELLEVAEGLKIILYPTLNTPYVYGNLAILGGGKKNTFENGFESLLSRVWPKSFESMNESQFNELKEMKAFQLHSFSGRHSLGLSFQFLPGQKNQFMEYFKKSTQEIYIPEDILKREKLMVENQRKARIDKPLQMGYLKLIESIFSGHYYSRDPLGQSSLMEELTTQKMKQSVKEHLNEGPKVLCLSGNVHDKEALIKSFQEALSSFENKKEAVFQEFKFGEKVEFQKDTQKEQAHLFQAYPSLKMNESEMPILDVIEGILSGQGGRLFLKLRDEKSLAYSVAPIRFEGLEAGVFMTYISCSPSKKQEALKAMQIEIQKLTQDLVPDEELERTKNYIVGQFVSQLQRSSFRNQSACFDVLYGQSELEHLNWVKKVRAVTANEILKLSQKLFKTQIAEIIYG